MIKIGIILLVVGLAFGTITSAMAEANPPGLVEFVKGLVAEGLQAHHKELNFSIDPGGSYSFALPKVQAPVRIEVSFSLLNGGTQKPSEIMYAVVNQDPESGQMTWVGTNNEGSQQGSNSLDGTAIAHIYGAASPVVNAVMGVDDLGTGTVKISQSAETTILPGHHIVHLWY